MSYRNVSTETPSRVFNKFFRIVFYHVTFFLLINQEFSCENYIDKEIESSDVRLLHVNKYCTELYRTVGTGGRGGGMPGPAPQILRSVTGKSLSEALIFAEHGENMLCTKIVLNVRNNFCTQHVLPRLELGIFMY